MKISKELVGEMMYKKIVYINKIRNPKVGTHGS